VALVALGAVFVSLGVEVGVAWWVGNRAGVCDLVGRRWCDCETAMLQCGFTAAIVLVVLGTLDWPSTLPLWLSVGCGGVGVVAGSGVRGWAIVTLGRWFDRDATVRPEQTLVTTGPYRLLSHPAYVGNIVFVAGLGLAVTTVPVAALAVLITAMAHVPRIRMERSSLASLRTDDRRRTG
jgi:isoprenylcysteine carboxyl methyltransferase (ICMT) family protein YpbQ